MNLEKSIGDFLEKYIPLSEECQAELLVAAKLLTLKKGSTLVREGQYSEKCFYLLEGCARAFYLRDGHDISDWFAFENEFISSIVSFFDHRPSPHYIELLEDAVLLEFSRENIMRLADKYHDFERLIRLIVTETMLGQQARITCILFQKAEQRYENLLETFPNITQRVNLTHIASYLGITLETLSRVRKQKKRI